jgi:hypothetical protein
MINTGLYPLKLRMHILLDLHMPEQINLLTGMQIPENGE